MKFVNNGLHLKLICGILSMIFACLSVFAQTEKPKVSADEATAARKVESAKTFAEKMTATDVFFKKYPQSPLRKNLNDYLAAQVFVPNDDNQTIANSQTYMAVFTDPTETDPIVPALVDALIRLKKLDEAYATADKYLARHDDDVSVRLQLAIEGSNQLRGGNGKYAAQTKDYSSKVIELIEANKKPANLTDENWKEYQTKWLAELYTALGFAYLNLNDRGKAQTSFEKTVSIDQNSITGWYMVGTMLNENYQDLAKKYMVATGTEKSEMLPKANEALDKVIEMFARVVALTDGAANYKPLNDQTRQDLESYYKYRHNNSTTGLQELINKYKPVKTN